MVDTITLSLILAVVGLMVIEGFLIQFAVQSANGFRI